MKKYMAIAGLVLVTVIWGGGFVASDMALDSLSPFQIMTIRFLLASWCRIVAFSQKVRSGATVRIAVSFCEKTFG